MDRNGRFDPMVLEKVLLWAIKVKTEVNVMKAAALNNEGIVQYRHHFGDGSATYIIMEYCLLGVPLWLFRTSVTWWKSEKLSLNQRWDSSWLKWFPFSSSSRKPISFIVSTLYLIQHQTSKLLSLQRFYSQIGRLRIGNFQRWIIQKEKKHLWNTKLPCSWSNWEESLLFLGGSLGHRHHHVNIFLYRYTMLMGIPPFEAKTCDDTYRNIKRC